MLQSMQFTQLIIKDLFMKIQKKCFIMLYNWELINVRLLSDRSEISSNGTSRSPQMKSIPFGNFNMCNKFDFNMFKNSVGIGIKHRF